MRVLWLREETKKYVVVDFANRPLPPRGGFNADFDPSAPDDAGAHHRGGGGDRGAGLGGAVSHDRRVPAHARMYQSPDDGDEENPAPEDPDLVKPKKTKKTSSADASAALSSSSSSSASSSSAAASSSSAAANSDPSAPSADDMPVGSPSGRYDHLMGGPKRTFPEGLFD